MQEENQLRKLYGEDEALSNRLINYAYYCKLLYLSKFNPNTKLRYLTKQQVVEHKLYKNENGYRAFRRKISKLIEFGLIHEDEDSFYFSDCERYFITEKETLRYLTNVSNDDVLRTYVFLGKMYNWSKNKADHTKIISIDTICLSIGRDLNTYNRKLVKNVLIMLSNSNLVEYTKDERKMLTTTDKVSSHNNIILNKVNIKYKN